MRIQHANGYRAAILALSIAAPTLSFAVCQNSNTVLQQQCLSMELQRAQQEAQLREQQRAQQRAQQQAQIHVQQEAQERAQQEAQQRAQQQAQQRAQQEAQQREQQQAQQRAQEQAQQRSRQEVQQRLQEQSQQRRQQDVQPKVAQERKQQQGAREVMPPHPAQETSHPATTAHHRPQDSNGPSDANAHPTAAASRPSAAAPPKSIPLSANTKVVVRPNSSVLTVRHTEANGSQVVLNRRFAAGKPIVAGAYVSHREANGDRTKTFLDGHKIVYSKNGDVARISPNHITVTTQKAGLRQAVLAGGRPVFRERVEHRAYGTASQEVIVRTEYARVEAGRPVFYSEPVIRHYDMVSYYGFPVLAYEPVVFSPVFFGPFLVGFAQPVVVTAACIFCPAPVVTWQQPVATYSDPVDLVADLQITSAVQDGMADAPPQGAISTSQSLDDPQLADLKVQVNAMQQQADAAMQSNAELRDQVAELQQNSVSTPATAAAAFRVPEVVRQQIHKQVREDIKLHQQKRPLTWPDIVAAGDAPNYIFQVSDMIDATDNSGEECPVTAGDLLKLEPGTPPDKDVLSLRVVTGKSGSCLPGAVISVSIHDAQAMLNDFNQRLEANMQKLQPQIAVASTH